MKSRNTDSIKTMGLQSLEIIFNVASEIQSEIELTGSNEILFGLNTFSYKYEAKAKGLNCLVTFGAIKITNKIATGDITTGYQLVVDEKKNALVITEIKKRMVELAKGIIHETEVKVEKVRLIRRGKYDIIILYKEEILSTESGGAPASLMRILFKNINGQYRDIDYILANTKFSDRKQIWDTIKEFRKRLKKGKIKSGPRKQGYLLLLPT